MSCCFRLLQRGQQIMQNSIYLVGIGGKGEVGLFESNKIIIVIWQTSKILYYSQNHSPNVNYEPLTINQKQSSTEFVSHVSHLSCHSSFLFNFNISASMFSDCCCFAFCLVFISRAYSKLLTQLHHLRLHWSQVTVITISYDLQCWYFTRNKNGNNKK